MNKKNLSDSSLGAFISHAPSLRMVSLLLIGYLYSSGAPSMRIDLQRPGATIKNL
jgi:hypothetical protein